MKITLYIRFLLLIFVILTFVPNSFAQVTPPRNAVQIIHFVPNDHTPQRDINAKLDTLMKEVQAFFADEMERHGFGRKTFALETDAAGEVVVHRVNGRKADAYYHKETRQKVTTEVSLQRFYARKNIYVVIVDVSTEQIGADFGPTISAVCGVGGHRQQNTGDLGGRAFMPASGSCFNFGVMAHELGHTFGLYHDFSNDAYIMSYGGFKNELAPCTAEWLDAHRYFNSRQTPPNNSRTVIRILPVAASPPYGMRYRFQVSDSDGLQIAQLLTPATDKREGPGQSKLIGCQKLAGQSQVVEFVTTELTAQSKLISIHVVDGAGNWTYSRHASQVSALFPSEVISIPDANLAAAVRESLELPQRHRITHLDMLALRGLAAAGREIADLSGLEHARNLKYLYLENNQIRDITAIRELTSLAVLNLLGNPIEDTGPARELPQVHRLHLPRNQVRNPPPEPVTPRTGPTQNPDERGSDVVSIPDRNLAAAVRKTLRLGSNAPITKQALRGLTRLDARDSQIKNLSGLEHATRLSSLELRSNQIRDIRPVSNLKSLKELVLDSNRVSDIRPLAKMKQLTWLLIGGNPISDFTPLTHLTQLRGLALWRTNMRDVSPIADLTELTNLWLGNNNIRDVTPLANLVNLKLLRLQSNQIRDVSPLAGLVALETLNLKNNPIQDAAPLATLTKLKEVDIEIPKSKPIPATGIWLAPHLPGLARSQFTIKPGAFAILVHRGKPPVTGGTDFNNYFYLGQKSPQAPQDPDFPNLALFLQDGGRIELISNTGFNPLPPGRKHPQFGDVVVSEIMWGLEGAAPAKQYIELYNASAHTYTFTDGNLSVRFSTVSEAALPNKTFRLPANPNAHVKVIDRVSTKGWRVPGKSGNISQNKPLISMYRTIDYTTGDIPDGTLASSWKASIGRVNLRAPSYGTPGAKHLPPLPTVFVESSEHPPMYWIDTNTGRLHRLVGAKVENLVPSVRNATNLAVDRAEGKLYWTEKTSNRTGKIRRANLDGTNVRLVKNLTSVPHGIVLDTANRKIYVTNAWGKIQRLNFDGSNFQPNLITDLEMPSGLALDVAGGKVYWTEMSGQIRRANLDGSNLQNVASGVGTPMNIAVSGDTVYWTVKTSEDRGEIRSVNLRGTQNVVTFRAFDQGFPVGIAVDGVAEKLYWTTSRGEIGRSNLEGRDSQPSFVTGLNALGVFALSVEIEVESETKTVRATDAVLRLSPSPIASPTVGERLTLNLKIAAGEAVAGYQVTLQFDAAALRYVESTKGDYLPEGALFVPLIVTGNSVALGSASLTGVTNGDGTLATITFEVRAAKASTLTLSEALLSDSQGNTFRPHVERGEVTEPLKLKGDVNSDGIVNIQDLVLVASSFGKTGQSAADINGDGVVNIADLVLVAGSLSTGLGAPSLDATAFDMFTTAGVREWLSQAHQLNRSHTDYQRGVLVLEHLLLALTPKATLLFPNYPNPFNPETWIPYQLAKSGDVKITIYDARGTVVRHLALGHQPAGSYQHRSRAAYWDGRNALGEKVASSVYFYTLSAGDFTATRKMVILK